MHLLSIAEQSSALLEGESVTANRYRGGFSYHTFIIATDDQIAKLIERFGDMDGVESKLKFALTGAVMSWKEFQATLPGDLGPESALTQIGGYLIALAAERSNHRSNPLEEQAARVINLVKGHEGEVIKLIEHTVAFAQRMMGVSEVALQIAMEAILRTNPVAIMALQDTKSYAKG